MVTWATISGIVIGAFYWFEWRPSQIRKECNNQVESAGVEQSVALSGEQYIKWQSIKAGFYNACLRKKGLEK